MTKSNFERDIFSKEIGDRIKGFIPSSPIKKLREDNQASKGQVMIGMEYRPDKISAYYYGSTDYDWVILAVNTTKGLQDLTLGKELVIPSINLIATLGVR